MMWEALAGASQSLLQHRKSGYFLEPVDPVALDLNDYREVVRVAQNVWRVTRFGLTWSQVKEPSDLGTVCARVQRQVLLVMIIITATIHIIIQIITAKHIQTIIIPACAPKPPLCRVLQRCSRRVSRTRVPPPSPP